MTDFFDRASALARARQPASTITALQCHDCGDDNPAERRKAVPGCTHCVECQAINEHQGRSRR